MLAARLLLPEVGIYGCAVAPQHADGGVAV
jgi:hypothetical protein